MEKASININGFPSRLYSILARNAPVGVVFRRGPSDWVQLLKWDTQNDIFTPGQWFKGRIYERRCDLSPDGSLLIYFASKITAHTIKDSEYTYAWTAISKPPYFTALALWPKGNCWHGGGMFESEIEVWLNHVPDRAIPHPKHLPKGLKITPNPNAHGEDGPVWTRRMLRDGWEHIQTGSYPYASGSWITEAKEILERKSPDGESTLRVALEGIDFSVPGGPYVESFTIIDHEKNHVILKDVRWADFDQSGRLVFVRHGMIFEYVIKDGEAVENELVDLNRNRPDQVIAPQWAQNW